MRAFQAYGKAGRVTAGTPREAAARYFAEFPTSRKCNIVEGKAEGRFFTVSYGRASNGEWPSNWKDVSKNTVAKLPGPEAPQPRPCPEWSDPPVDY